MIKQAVKKVLYGVGIEIRRVPAVQSGCSSAVQRSQDEVKRVLYFYRLLDMVRNVEGDIAECGVGWGGSLIWWIFFCQTSTPRNIWGFDSFEGFPQPGPEDIGFRNPQKGQWKTSREAVFSLLEEAGFDSKFLIDHVKLVKGFFSDTLSHYSGESIALLHLDCDLYQSYKDCLNLLWPKVSVGGVVAFDEYNDPKWPGATRAIDEFFSGRRERITEDKISGKYYVLKISND